MYRKKKLKVNNNNKCYCKQLIEGNNRINMQHMAI